jgi:hypothetical protein
MSGHNRLDGAIGQVDDNGYQRRVLVRPKLNRVLGRVPKHQDVVLRMLRLQSAIHPFVVRVLVAENKIHFMRSGETER